MLRQRVITGAIGALVVVFAIFRLSTIAFGLAAAVVLMVAAWEWAMLGGLRNVPSRLAYAALIVAIGALAAAAMHWAWWVPTILSAACLLWLYLTYRVVAFGRIDGLGLGMVQMRVLGIGILISTWIALVWMHRQPVIGPALVMMTLILVWAADTGAYFAGRRWGRRKLAPRVSPGKTVEGALGGLAMVAAVAVIAGVWFGFSAGQWLLFVGLCLLCFVASVLGDLFESMAKRQQGVKDSGAILPGHGGVLDRIDSLTAAAPVFAGGMLWLLN
jgi:phosphatidate cytidylyltransferase